MRRLRFCCLPEDVLVPCFPANTLIRLRGLGKAVLRDCGIFLGICTCVVSLGAHAALKEKIVPGSFFMPIISSFYCVL